MTWDVCILVTCGLESHIHICFLCYLPPFLSNYLCSFFRTDPALWHQAWLCSLSVTAESLDLQDTWLKQGELGPMCVNLELLEFDSKRTTKPPPLVWIRKKIIPNYSSPEPLDVKESLHMMEVLNKLNYKVLVLKREKKVFVNTWLT